MNVYLSPAKLNLFLHVTGRRSDGYHELQTCFQFLDFADELFISVRSDGQLKRLRALTDVSECQDLCLKAARLLQERLQVRSGADIKVDKRIPMGAGLGGGSSNAATVLMALNKLWQLNLSRQELCRLGLDIGADVPIFIHGNAAWAEGVGEQFVDIDIVEPCYVIVVPPVTVSTVRVFSSPDLTRDSPRIRIRDFLNGQVRNDLQPVVCRMFPQVAESLEWLSGFGNARMTGTGACLFLPVSDAKLGKDILRQLPSGNAGFVAHGLNRHPLADLLPDA